MRNSNGLWQWGVLACGLWIGAGAHPVGAADAPGGQPPATAQVPVPAAESSAAKEAAAPERRDTEIGFAIFQQRCLTCHGKAAYERAPAPSTLRSMSPERIYAALTTGVMKSVGDTLSEVDRRRVSESVSGQLLGAAQSGDAANMPNRCASNPPLANLSGPGWNGWGNGTSNNRFQPASAAGLTAEQVPHLKLKWAFGYSGGTSAFGQPTVVAGRVFVGTDTGFVYSLDASSGCVYWSYRTQAGVRNAMTLGPVKVAAGKPGADAHFAVFFGDLKANVYAVDAQTGTQIWTKHVEKNYTTRITAAPALYNSRLYVPISAWEGFSAHTLDYPCCTAVGSVSALDANTGKILWKTYSIAQRPRPTHKNSLGVQLWAPAGAPIWNTPTVDPDRHALYVGTGDATTYPAPPTSDSVLALDLATGKVLWSRQIYEGDSFIVGCSGAGLTENCPKVSGPDWDVPMSPMLKKLSDGRELLLFGTKPGDVFALNPAESGSQVWRVDLFSDSAPAAGTLPAGAPPKRRANRGPVWGGALDDQYAYFGLSGGGVTALRMSDGSRAWYTPLNSTAAKRILHSAAATAIPGVIFVGGSDGMLWAIASGDGKPLWSFETAKPFETVNHVAAHGGSMSAPGAIVAGGMLFVGSGYGVVGSSPGNVLLAFSAD